MLKFPIVSAWLATCHYSLELKMGGIRRCAAHQDFGTSAKTDSHLLQGAQDGAVGGVG
jgi:hypothetical protein